MHTSWVISCCTKANAYTLIARAKCFRIKLRAGMASQGTDLEEREANLFAAEFLMPLHFIARDLDQIEDLDLEDDALMKGLAKSYGVSVQALTFRLAYLGYVSLE